MLGDVVHEALDGVHACRETGSRAHKTIDTSSAGGRLIVHVLAALAEFDRDLIRERTVAGLEVTIEANGNHALGRALPAVYYPPGEDEWVTEREISPLAEIYPLMGPVELAELAESIRRNGLREPVVIRADGTVLDGRNRLRACKIAEVEPRFVEFSGTDREALELVVDTNSHRRHLSESARSLVAARLATFTHGGRRDGSDTALLTQRDAAERLGISERSVRDGKVVIDHAPAELVDDVQRGLIAVRAAAELIRSAGKDKVLVAEYHRLRRESGSAEWYTPPHVLARVIELLGEIDLDPASNEGEPWVTARAHYTKSDNGLEREWRGRVFVNPPWDSQGSPGRWVTKLLNEHAAGRVSEAVCLLPARVNTAWMDGLAPYARCFVRGRLRFGDATGDAPFPVVLVYLGDRAQDFVNVFDDLGSCYGHLRPVRSTE